MKQKFLLILAIIAILISANNSVYATVVPAAPANGEPQKVTLKSALKEFYSLSKKERKTRIKAARKAWKQYRSDVNAGKAKDNDNNILAIIFAILIPFVGVLIYEGKITTKFWIALLLTLLFWLPGAVYALLVVTGNA